jgi:hypothetical protein
VKRAIIFIIIGVAIGAGGLWLATHGPAGGPGKPDADDAAPAKASGDDAGKTTTSHDTAGNVVVGMSKKTQGDIGIVVAAPTATQLVPEVKAYGHVVDPAPIADLMLQLAAAEATFDSSHQELERTKTLNQQNNASERALQTAEATYQQNLIAAGSIRTKIELGWGHRLADLTGNVVVPPGTQRQAPPGPNPLKDEGTILIRLDLPIGDTVGSQPETARIVPLRADAQPIVANYFDEIPAVDPQSQTRGFLFFATTNSLKAGESITGYIQTGGDAVKGVIVPRDAIVRTEGKGWVYVVNDKGESFTRREIPLDHAVENGWFVTGLTADQQIVVTGAQVLLSEELKASMSPD